jgi:hypothetical protein
LGGAAAMPHVLLHGCELLFLLIRENGFNLAAGFLRYRPSLGASVVLRSGLIGAKRFELLLAIDKQGLDLALLIGRQVELLRHVLQLGVGIHAAGTAPLLRLIRRRGRGTVLRLGGGRAAEHEHAAKSESYEF